MNWYLDFDSTLFDTDNFRKKLLEKISFYIDKSNNQKRLDDVTKTFYEMAHEHNIPEIAAFFDEKYSLEKGSILKLIFDLLENGSSYVYSDTIPFLEKLKKAGNTINILTYSMPKGNMDFQVQKLKGSGLCNFFDAIIITANRKHTLDIKYENGIFVDDNPKDLENLYNVHSKRVIRIRRNGAGYAKIPLNISEIEEYNTLSDILV